VALVALGLGLAIGLVEGVLQLGALAKRLTGRESDAAWLTTRRRIVALGDSNTYGVMVERGEAYPRVFERLWNVGEHRPLEVLNLGYPGTNSSQVRRNLPHVIDALKPDEIIVMVGVNDLWTAPVPVSDQSDPRGPVRRFIEQHSRTYKLWYMLERAFFPGEVEESGAAKTETGATGRIRVGAAEFEVGYEQSSPPDGWSAALRRNLRAIVKACKVSGVELTLMAYQTDEGFYGSANRIIRRIAAESGAAFIDLHETFERECVDTRCKELLFWDSHPNVAGHRLIAEAVVRERSAREAAGR
jgi:lysophospholipase L1-like esterase